jgi:hypothetical protein
MDAVIECALAARPPGVDTLAAWWHATADVRGRWPSSIDRAIAGGAHADRIGFAFAGGYAEALRALEEVGDDRPDRDDAPGRRDGGHRR